MRVDDDSRRNSVSNAEHDVRGLARNAGKPEQLIHRSRNLAAKLLDEHLARALDRFRFVAKKAGGANVLLQLDGRNFQIVFGPAAFTKQIGGDDVYALVGALRGQKRGNQDLESA